MTSFFNLPSVSTSVILVDTGPLLSLVDKSDSEHIQAKLILDKIKSNKVKVIITNITIFEAYTKILYQVGWQKAIGFIDNLKNSQIPIERVTEQDEQEAKKILRKYKNTRISFVDALNFAVMIRKRFLYAFTFDKDYLILGFQMYS